MPREIIEIRGHLRFDNITSAEGFNLPKTVGGDLSLQGLTSAEGLILTDIKGTIYLNKIPDPEKDKLGEKYPHLWIP